MVDYDPWDGNFRGTSVHNNTILGGFATGDSDGELKGTNTHSAIIKLVFLFEDLGPLFKFILDLGLPSPLVRELGLVINIGTRLSKMVLYGKTDSPVLSALELPFPLRIISWFSRMCCSGILLSSVLEAPNAKPRAYFQHLLRSL